MGCCGWVQAIKYCKLFRWAGQLENHMNKISLIAIGILLCGAQIAQAQTSRPETGRARVTKVGTGEISCDNSSPKCPEIDVGVEVRTDGECYPSIDIGRINVPVHVSGQPKKIKIVWRINKAPSDRYKYRFTNNGVEMLGVLDSNGNVIMPHDSALDFSDPDYDPDPNDPASIDKKKMRYKWVSVHLRPPPDIEVSYNLSVQFRRNSSAPWRLCKPVDPTVVNKN